MKRNVRNIALTILACSALLVGCKKKDKGGDEPSIPSAIIDDSGSEITVNDATSDGLVFERDLDGEGFSIKDYVGASNNVIIPETFEGKPVKAIQSEAFREKKLVRVHIPANVETIGDYAFVGCPELNVITVAKNGHFYLENGALIKNLAVDDKGNPTSRLLAFVLPNKTGQFDIADNITRVVKGAFASTHLTILKFNPALIVGNFQFFFGPSSSSIPETVKEVILTKGDIADNSFAGVKAISAVVIYDIKNIGNRAFYNCPELTSVLIPDSVVSIGERAFANCAKLRRVRVGNTANPGLTTLGDYAFEGDGKLIFNETLDGIRYLGNETLRYFILMEPRDSALERVTIEPDTRFIASEAFKDCAKLNKVTYSEADALFGIGAHAFENCLELPASAGKFSSSLRYLGPGVYKGSKILTEASAQSGFKYTGDSNGGYAIIGRDSSANVSIKADTRFIDAEAVNTGPAISGFTSQSAEFTPSDDRKLLFTSDFKKLVAAAHGASYGGSFVFPDNVEEIAPYALSGIANMESFLMPTTLKVVGDGAFMNFNTGVSKKLPLELPSSLRLVGDNAFKGMGTIRSLVLNDGLLSVGANAFGEINGPTELYIPESVTYVGANLVKDSTIARIEVEADDQPSAWDASWVGTLDIETAVRFGVKR